MLNLPAITHNLIAAKCNKCKLNYSYASSLTLPSVQESVYFAVELCKQTQSEDGIIILFFKILEGTLTFKQLEVHKSVSLFFYLLSTKEKQLSTVSSLDRD